MASVQDLKRRIRSVRNTRKITKAMELVAAARLRRAAGADRGDAAVRRPDAGADGRHGPREHVACRGLPLLQRRETIQTVGDPAADRRPRPRRRVQRAGAAARASRSSGELRGEGDDVRWLVVGKKGRSTLRFRRYERRARRGPASPTGRRTPTPRRSRTASPSSTSSGEVDRVVLVYNHFVSPLVQQVVEQDVLPIPRAACSRRERGGARDDRARRRLHLRAGAGGDPRAAAPGLRRDRALPRAARVGGVRAGRAHDGDAQRLEERRRADRPPDARR